MKKVAIMQPYFFPYIGYWQLINAVDEFLIYDDVNFIKGGWINRNNILLNGDRHLITLPLAGASPFSLIRDIKLVDNIKQKEKLLRTIEQAYKKAPYYQVIMPIIKNSILYPTNNIVDVVSYAIKEVTKYLDINTQFKLSSSLEKDNDLKGQDKVIHVCKLLKTEKYINAIGGMELYEKAAFMKEGIELSFLKTNQIKYNQYDNEFVPWLSMIDILMFNDTSTIKNYLNEYKLI